MCSDRQIGRRSVNGKWCEGVGHRLLSPSDGLRRWMLGEVRGAD